MRRMHLHPIDRRPAVVVLGALALAVLAGSAMGDLAETRLSTTPQAFPFTRLGSAVALADGLAIVGAPGANNGAQDAGAVYLFEQIGPAWLQTATLIAEDGKRGDDFGEAVASAAGTVAVLGDGEIYVFERGDREWRQTGQLAADAGAAPFESLAMAGDLLVAGATSDRTAGRGAGALQVFEKTNGEWLATQKLIAPGASRKQGAGRVVATDGRTIAAVDRVGTLSVFQETEEGWVSGDLPSLSPGAVTQVAVAGRWIVAALRAPEPDSGESVLLLRRLREGWKEVALLRVEDFGPRAPIPAAIDSLDTDGRRIVLGQREGGFDQAGVRPEGIVHVLRRQGRRLLYENSLQGQSPPPGGDLPFGFGSSVALERPLILVGSPGVASAYVRAYP